MKDWERDKAWSDVFIPTIAAIAGRHLIRVAPAAEDMKRNTDLIVFSVDGGRMGARIRKPGYYQRFGRDFTIRSDRPSGAETELSKLMAGWGDYFFYGFASEDVPKLKAWCLIDLDALRGWFSRHKAARGVYPGALQRNWDKTEFLAVNIALAHGKGAVIAQRGMLTCVDDTATLPMKARPFVDAVFLPTDQQDFLLDRSLWN